MTGERLAWFRVASHLGMSVARLSEEITFTEFLDWLEYLKWEEARETKQDAYLAQIACETRRGWVSEPKKVKMDDFILKFGEPAKPSSKDVWASILGIKLDKN